MTLPSIHQCTDLILETAKEVLRENLGTALAALGALAEVDLPEITDGCVEIGDIRGVLPQLYPSVRLLPVLEDFGLHDAPLGLEDVRVHLLVRAYVQSAEASTEPHTMTLLQRKNVLVARAIRQVIERDLTPANGALGVYAVSTAQGRYIEPFENGSARRAIVAVSETTFHVDQRVQRAQFT